MSAFYRSVIALFLVACGGASAPPANPPSSQAAAAPPTAVAAAAAAADAHEPAPSAEAAAEPAPLTAMPPTIKLVEAGAAPRRALRYKFKKGAVERMEMDMKMTVATSMGGPAANKTVLPTVRSVMKIEAVDVKPEGDAECTFETERVDVLKDAALPPQMRALLEQETKAIVGLRGTSRISSRGVPSDTTFALPPDASPKLKNQLDTLRDALRQVYMPLPEEEVGKGAKWEVAARIAMMGAMLDSKAIYTVTKLDTDSVHADVDVTLSAPPNQAMSVGALPPGASATLESMTGKAAGKTAPSLVKLVSTASSKMTTTSTFSVAMGAEKMQMQMSSDIDVTIRPSKAAPKAAPKK